MKYIVLIAWLVQSVGGVTLFARWWRHGRHGARIVIIHVSLILSALTLWLVYIALDLVLAAWITFAIMAVSLSFGDSMLVKRWQRENGTSSFWADYGKSIGAVFRGRMPKMVVFHALFSPVVFFTCLAECIRASLALS